MNPFTVRGLLEAVGERMLERGCAAMRWAHPVKRAHLESVVGAFLTGYQAACRERQIGRLMRRLSHVTPWLRGFAYEGAAMPLVMLDTALPWSRRRFERLLAAAPEHRYLLHVGGGWGLAQLGMVAGRRLDRFDPLLKWLMVDAAGFRDGFLHAPRLDREPALRRQDGAVARVFDQGLGRSLWFTTEANPAAIAAAIAAVDRQRHADLWSGVGLACAYAGGVEAVDLAALCRASGPFLPHFAQGVAFAAAARVSAGDGVPHHTERACLAACAMSADQAARLVGDAERRIRRGAGPPCYETWRAQVRAISAHAVLSEVQVP